METLSINISEDAAALIVNNEETFAVCHFCGINDKLQLKMGHPLMYNKPEKWAIVFGGNMRKPKRFFICDKCAKIVVRK